jgi:hypothetical protein
MSTEYPGLPSVARGFWYIYLLALAGGLTLLTFTAAIAAVVVLIFTPEAGWFLLIASVGYLLHSAVLLVNDIRTGEYEPSQASYSSAKEIMAVILLVGVYQSTVLLIGTGGAFLIESTLAWPAVVAVAVAAYYPVADLLLMRQGVKTPGAIAFLAVLIAVDAILNIHQSTVNVLPVIGKRRRPQS